MARQQRCRARQQRDLRFPVEHIVTEQSAGSPFDVTLVVANRTTSSDALIAELQKLCRQRAGRARAPLRLSRTDRRRRRPSCKARPRPSHAGCRARAGARDARGRTDRRPGPLHRDDEALAFFDVDDIVISTYPQTRSGWLRADLIERVKKSSGLTVDHIVAEPAAARSGA